MWTTTCRLVSLALRFNVPMDEIIKQLDRSSGHMLDLPAQLSKLFKSFLAGTQQGFASICPECNGKLVFEDNMVGIQIAEATFEFMRAELQPVASAGQLENTSFTASAMLS